VPASPDGPGSPSSSFGTGLLRLQEPTLSYFQIHDRLKRELGVARDQTCECGSSASDWAYQHTGQPHVDADGIYSDDVSDYAPMCRGCHLKLDYSKGTVRGFSFLWNNPSSEYLKIHAAAARSNAEKAREVLRVLQEDPATSIRERQSEGGRIGGCAQRRRCQECGKITTAAPLGSHQKASGHQGWEPVE
jgi:hypothetical protein